jgi:hypothetical protein
MMYSSQLKNLYFIDEFGSQSVVMKSSQIECGRGFHVVNNLSAGIIFP